MMVSKSAEFRTFAGEEGERLALRILSAESPAKEGGLEFSVECEDHCFRTVLDPSEAAKLSEFLGLGYRNEGSGLLVFRGDQGEQLTFRHSNMGEPYREGVEVRVEGVDDFPDYLGPFVESSEIRRARAFITQ